VRNAEIYQQVTELPTFHDALIRVRTGDRITPTRDLFGTLDLGFVVLAGQDHGQIQADYEAVRALERRLQLDGDAASPVVVDQRISQKGTSDE
jgi:hypothetical protein